ncbi:3TM-type holin [Novosphingobium huizhouense]|uniref:3TM-type holin n=1 Tax=Novosphingobium huizhouense TaxID=2866625 RepID=UPI001CD8D5AC|nr:3TM-type holin [Novosphingobium huizhouense]
MSGDRLATSESSCAVPRDVWVERARPTFLYVMYGLILWSIPLGLLAAVRPDLAAAVTRAMSAYFNGLPEPLYALFGTGYVGYTVARQWGKAQARP